MALHADFTHQLYFKALSVAAAVALHQHRSFERSETSKAHKPGQGRNSRKAWRLDNLAPTSPGRVSAAAWKRRHLFYVAFRHLVLGSESISSASLEEYTRDLVSSCSQWQSGLEADLCLFADKLAKFVLSTNSGGALRAVFILKSLLSAPVRNGKRAIVVTFVDVLCQSFHRHQEEIATSTLKQSCKCFSLLPLDIDMHLLFSRGCRSSVGPNSARLRSPLPDNGES